MHPTADTTALIFDNLAGRRVMPSVVAPLRAPAVLGAGFAPVRTSGVELSLKRGRSSPPRPSSLYPGGGRVRRQPGAAPQLANAPDRRHESCHLLPDAPGGG
jgi:hypothetical protein